MRHGTKRKERPSDPNEKENSQRGRSRRLISPRNDTHESDSNGEEALDDEEEDSCSSEREAGTTEDAKGGKAVERYNAAITYVRTKIFRAYGKSPCADCIAHCLPFERFSRWKGAQRHATMVIDG